MYVIHLAVCVGMLCIMIPFGKLGHLFYRPLAIYLTTVKEKATKDSHIDLEVIKAEIGETFMTCLQCGTCTAMCPWNQVSSYNPRQILRHLSLDSCTEQSVDQAVWSCVTCNQCGEYCPSGIDIIDLVKSVRGQNIDSRRIPKQLEAPLGSLKENGNPWSGLRKNRLEWAGDIEIPTFTQESEYCLFTCCTTAYDTSSSQGSQMAGRALPRLLNQADISFGTLGTKESCCGEQVQKIGAIEIFSDLARQNTDLFKDTGVQKILTNSPHCLNAFKKNYKELHGAVGSEHYTELLDRLVADGRLKPVLEVDCIVTYHDPCYLGRHNGIYDAPRRILQRIPGLTLVEMPSHKERSLCCGGGGGGAWNSAPPDQRLDVLRIREALKTGADVIATACPYCIRMLNDAVNQLGVADQIEVRDLAELLLQSVEMPGQTNQEDKTESFNRSFDQEECHV
jgi:Fe-S oxidoreductase